MITDPQRVRRTDPGRPEICPVFAWHKLFSPPETVATRRHRMPHRRHRLRRLQETHGRKPGHMDRAGAGPPQGIRGPSAARLGYPRRRRSKKAHDAASETMKRVRNAIFKWEPQAAQAEVADSLAALPRTQLGLRQSNDGITVPYRINLPVYEGPLDLLLDLIRKQEMDIHNIPIAKVTEQYLDYLHQLEKLDIDVSADFIYMAATLIHIKSKMLLPADPLAGPEERGSARRTGPSPTRTRKIQERRAAALPKAADRSPRLVAARSQPLHGRRHRRRTGRFARRSGQNLPADSRTPQGSPKFELQHESVTIAQMMDRLRQRLMATEDPISLSNSSRPAPRAMP